MLYCDVAFVFLLFISLLPFLSKHSLKEKIELIFTPETNFKREAAPSTPTLECQNKKVLIVAKE